MEYEVVTLNGLKMAFEFEEQREVKSRFVAVLVYLGDGHYETIINSHVKFKEKLEYYENAYTDDLRLKNNPRIKIINYTFANSFADIQDEFYYEPEED